MGHLDQSPTDREMDVPSRKDRPPRTGVPVPNPSDLFITCNTGNWNGPWKCSNWTGGAVLRLEVGVGVWDIPSKSRVRVERALTRRYGGIQGIYVKTQMSWSISCRIDMIHCHLHDSSNSEFVHFMHRIAFNAVFIEDGSFGRIDIA